MHRNEAYMLSASWGSGALAGLAGTAAWWHGTDPAWWLASMDTWPEHVPWEAAAEAQRWYDGASKEALKAAPTPASASPQQPSLWCSLRCGFKYPGRRDKLAECLVQECGADPRTVQALQPQPDLTRNIVATVIAVGLVLVGAYGLVK